MSHSKTSKWTDDEFRQLLVELQNTACENFPALMNKLGLDVRRQGKRYVGPCPVHGGDNPTGLNIYPDGYDIKGIWRCRTNNCHKRKHPDSDRLMYGQTLLGLIRGIIHHQTGQYPKLKEAVDILLDFCEYKSLEDIGKIDQETLARRKLNNAFRRLNMSPTKSKSSWTREQVRSLLQIPSPYYVDRGFCPKILDKYDVGTYQKKNRVAVPVYDDEYKHCVGFTGRTLHPHCDECDFWHPKSGKCPQTTLEKAYAVKWKNSDGFNTGHYLYNYWFAKEDIFRTGCVILVEGPSEVWRLAEAGIRNVVALFGTSLTDEQRVILERSGALSAVISLDGDEAGREGASIIKTQLERQFRLFFPTFGDGDIGGLQTDTVTADVKPLLQQLTSYYATV